MSTKIQFVQTIFIKRDRNPTTRDGAFAVAELQGLANGQLPSKKELAAAGFAENSPGLWVHKDGSWVDNDGHLQTPEFGIGTDRLQSMPELLPRVTGRARSDARPSLKGKNWAWFKANTALGKASTVASDYSGKAALMRQGFVVIARRSQTETWVHPDGSWVKGDFQGGPIGSGWKGYDMPELRGPASPNLAKLLDQQPAIPASMRNHGIAKIGMVNPSTIDAACANAGFHRVGNHWIHNDGSWAKLENGSVVVGWKGHPLASLPYRANQGWY